MYIQAIEQLKEELHKEQPYDKFLSLVKKEDTTEYSSCEVPTDDGVPTYYEDPYSYLSCVYSEI